MTEELEQCCIFEIAAKIIKDAIKALDANNNNCSCPDGMKSFEKKNPFLPKSLRIVLDNFVVGKVKSVVIASLGQRY